MNLMNIHEHTLDMDLLTPGGIILDAGCRDFRFASAVTSLGCRVLGLDADPSLAPEIIERFEYRHRALLASSRIVWYVGAGNGGKVVADGSKIGPIHSITMPELTREFGVFDAVKMDIEGSEYEVLLAWPGPIAKQISIEYHDHCNQGKDIWGPDIYERIDRHLGQWYTMVHAPVTTDSLGRTNLYDCLWVLK